MNTGHKTEVRVLHLACDLHIGVPQVDHVKGGCSPFLHSVCFGLLCSCDQAVVSVSTVEMDCYKKINVLFLWSFLNELWRFLSFEYRGWQFVLNVTVLWLVPSPVTLRHQLHRCPQPKPMTNVFVVLKTFLRLTLFWRVERKIWYCNIVFLPSAVAKIILYIYWVLILQIFILV